MSRWSLSWQRWRRSLSPTAQAPSTRRVVVDHIRHHHVHLQPDRLRGHLRGARRGEHHPRRGNRRSRRRGVIWWLCRSRGSGERGPDGHARPDPLRQRRRHPDRRTSNCFETLTVSAGSTVAGQASMLSWRGGGGGGASDVRTVIQLGDQSGSLVSRLIVAGGGGGSGQGRGWASATPLPGGTGGDAGSDGGDGTPCPSETGGTGGDAGSQSAGGSGGSPEGQSGSLGLGGNGGGNSVAVASVAVAAAATTAVAAAGVSTAVRQRVVAAAAPTWCRPAAPRQSLPPSARRSPSATPCRTTLRQALRPHPTSQWRPPVLMVQRWNSEQTKPTVARQPTTPIPSPL